MTKQGLHKLFEYLEETCNQSIIRFYIKNHRKHLKSGFNVPKRIQKPGAIVSSSKRRLSIRKSRKGSKNSFKALKGCFLDTPSLNSCDLRLQ